MRSDRRRLWPWLAGLGVAALLVWLAVSIGERGGPPAPAEPEAGRVEPGADAMAGGGGEPVAAAAAEEMVARTEEMRAAVRRYERECSARLEPVVGPGLGERVADCMARLGEAVDAIVATDTVGRVAIDERLEHYRAQVERLERTPPGEGRAGPTRDVLRSLVEVLAEIRDERYPRTLDNDGVIEDLRAAISAIEPERPLDDQRHPVRRFFLGAGGLLSAMARPGDPGPGS